MTAEEADGEPPAGPPGDGRVANTRCAVAVVFEVARATDSEARVLAES